MLLKRSVPTGKRLGGKSCTHGEERECIGGTCARHWEPFGVSNAWGSKYEVWEWKGSTARGAGQVLKDIDEDLYRPSRVDVAVDCFDVAWTPDDVRQEVIRRDEFKHDRADNSDGGYTLKVGGLHSLLRFRVYRKGMRELILGRMLRSDMPCQAERWQRVEAVLKDERARDFWKIWTHDEKRAYSMVHQKALTMTGINLGPVEAWAVADAAPASDTLRSVLHLIDQSSSVLLAAREAGIDIMSLASVRMDQASRTAVWRHQKRVRELQNHEAPEEWLMMMLLENEAQAVA